MEIAEAVKILGILQFFPKEPEQISEIAAVIDRHLSTPQEVEYLLDEMVRSGRCNEWPGIQALIAECKGLKPPPEWTSIPKPPVDCPECDDWGHVPEGDKRGRCHCPAGVALDDEFLELLNRPPAVRKPLKPPLKAQPTAILPLITQADIDRACAMREEARLRIA